MYKRQGEVYVRVNATQDQSEVKAGKCTEEEKACTIRVSRTASDDTARFFGAADDGSRAFFKIEDKNPPISPLNENLYEFYLESKKATLVAPKIGGVMGLDGDASLIYFLSKGALADANAEGKSPEEGRPNLYLYERSEDSTTTSFIATLSASDASTTPENDLTPVSGKSFKHTSRVTPNGRHVAFMSNASLTGYNLSLIHI